MLYILGAIWVFSVVFLCGVGTASIIAATSHTAAGLEGFIAGASYSLAWIIYRRWAKTLLGRV